MPNHDEMTRTVEAYVAAFAASDADAVVELFAQDATVEDPVGSEAHVGLEAIRTFYTHAVKIVTHMELDGSVRSANNTAAFALHIHLAMTPPMQVSVIELFHFNEAGKIVSMQAYFNEVNMSPIETK